MITPKDAQQVSDAETRQIQEAEQKIDLQLRDKYQGEGSVNITEPLDMLSIRARRALLSKYKCHGWNVTKKHHFGEQGDPRDYSYDYWEFRMAPPQHRNVDISDIK